MGVAVPPDLRQAAVERLIAARAGPQAREHAARFIEQAMLQGIDLGLLRASIAGRSVRQVCLPVVGAGRTGMVFVSGPGAAHVGDPAEQARERVGVVEAGAAALVEASAGLRLVQALPEPDQTWAHQALEGAGFRWIADLHYLSRPLHAGERGPRLSLQPVEPAGGGSWPGGVRVTPVSVTDPGTPDAVALASALEASYEDTQDCPGLVGLRETADILDSHRAVGRLDPRLWWVVWRGDSALGCVLLSACPNDDAVELVYLGLAPALRGLGLGRALLRTAIGAAARCGLRELRCGVDRGNGSACELYASAGFVRTAERRAWVRARG